MKVFRELVAIVGFLAVSSIALGDVPCQKCTHDMQVQYRKCLQSGKAQEVCTKQEQEAAQICVSICNPKPNEPPSVGTAAARPGP
jgi:hypothetical protein